jgi:hypothetical protein
MVESSLVNKITDIYGEGFASLTKAIYDIGLSVSISFFLTEIHFQIIPNLP